MRFACEQGYRKKCWLILVCICVGFLNSWCFGNSNQDQLLTQLEVETYNSLSSAGEQKWFTYFYNLLQCFSWVHTQHSLCLVVSRRLSIQSIFSCLRPLSSQIINMQKVTFSLLDKNLFYFSRPKKVRFSDKKGSLSYNRVTDWVITFSSCILPD